MARITKRFSDFAENEYHGLAGSKVRMQDILGTELTFTGYRIMQSKAVEGRECLQLQFHEGEDGQDRIVFTNSTVLMKQCQKYGDQFPFIACIVRHGRYYTFK